MCVETFYFVGCSCWARDNTCLNNGSVFYWSSSKKRSYSSLWALRSRTEHVKGVVCPSRTLLKKGKGFDDVYMVRLPAIVDYCDNADRPCRLQWSGCRWSVTALTLRHGETRQNIGVRELPIIPNYVPTLWTFLTKSVLRKTFRMSKYSLSNEQEWRSCRWERGMARNQKNVTLWFC